MGFIEVVVVQSVNDAVSAHRNADDGPHETSNGVVQVTALEEPVMGSVMSQYETSLLARGDDDDGWDDRPGRPPINRHANRRS